jgi:flagellum-specific ATP synthase
MFSQLAQCIVRDPFIRYYGRVQKVRRDSVRVFLPGVKVGAICQAETSSGRVPLEIVSLDPEGHVAMPLNDLGQVALGDAVTVLEDSAHIPVGEEMLGSVLDSMCEPYEGALTGSLLERMPLYGSDLNPMERSLITEPLDLGVRSVNACLTTGKGQRQGIFAGSGVGKSVLLGMIAKYTSADVVVIGLIGERGREVREFIERQLGPEGRKKSVVVVETADKSPIRRARGAYVATTVAEYFRRKGANVLLMMDSLTRFAMAQREIGIAAGEPPTTKGYTPSVFSQLSRLVERAGNWGRAGSITGLYTVLVEGDDLEDPVADSARAILDGHIVLARKLANKGHYPAVDVLASVSRVMDSIVDPGQVKAARQLKQLLARYFENEDAIHYGMYVRGTDPSIDECMDMESRINAFLRQDREERIIFGEARAQLKELMGS